MANLLKTPQARLAEGELAFAIADWFDGAPWTLSDAVWIPHGCPAVRLQEVGDTLLQDGHVIATRRPSAVAEYTDETAGMQFSNARAVARVALRGDHLALYPAVARSRLKTSLLAKSAGENDRGRLTGN